MAECSLSTGMIAAPVAGGPLHHQRPGHHEGFLVGEGHGLAGLDGGPGARAGRRPPRSPRPPGRSRGRPRARRGPPGRRPGACPPEGSGLRSAAACRVGDDHPAGPQPLGPARAASRCFGGPPAAGHEAGRPRRRSPRACSGRCCRWSRARPPAAAGEWPAGCMRSCRPPGSVGDHMGMGHGGRDHEEMATEDSGPGRNRAARKSPPSSDVASEKCPGQPQAIPHDLLRSPLPWPVAEPVPSHGQRFVARVRPT